MRPYVAVAWVLATAVMTATSAGWAADPAADAAQPAAAAAAPAAAGQPAAGQPATTPKPHRIRALLHKLSPRRLLDSAGLFKQAEKEFPAFCEDWGSKLKDRERNNVEHIDWKPAQGGEAGTYVGYGNILGCTCKQTAKGIPVGKLNYQEFEYELDGKTTDEALHAKPKENGITNTTEIFRFDTKQDKWIY
jgi:hypothetical protein